MEAKKYQDIYILQKSYFLLFLSKIYTNERTH